MTTYKATFVPQQNLSWLGSDCYPADPKGETTWDCTEFLNKEYTEAQRAAIVGDVCGSELTDSVHNDPNAPDWIRDWDGPYEVKVIETD